VVARVLRCDIAAVDDIAGPDSGTGEAMSKLPALLLATLSVRALN